MCVWARLLVEAVSVGMNLATFADIEPEFAACGTAFGHVPEIDTTLAGHTFAHSAGVCQLLSGREKRKCKDPPFVRVPRFSLDLVHGCGAYGAVSRVSCPRFRIQR